MPIDPLHRAKSYPYAIPNRSFVYRNGDPHYLEPGSATLNLDGRTPVLAVGSNQSPEQLARKFEGGAWGEIPVLRIVLHDYDSVYSPHIATYGAVAATLQEAPGVRVSLFVTWLTDDQLIHMHTTEVSSANYGFGQLCNLRVDVDMGPPLEALFIYNSTRGTLCSEGTPVPLSEVPAAGRTWAAMSQIEIQHHVQERLAPDSALDTFIYESINDPVLRRRRSDMLKVGARPFAPANFNEISI